MGRQCFPSSRLVTQRTLRTTKNTIEVSEIPLLRLEEEIIKTILDEAFLIHKSVGPGMLEKVYQTCLAYRLRQRGLSVEEEKPILVVFESVVMECGYRADLLVEKKIIVETKNIDAIADIHIAQVLTYLRFLDLRLVLILNFKTTLLKHGIRRVVRGYELPAPGKAFC